MSFRYVNHLRLVNRMQSLDRFYFDDDRALDEQVHLEIIPHAFSAVGHPHAMIVLETDLLRAQLDSRAVLLDRLQQSRPERRVNGDRAADDAFGDRLDPLGRRPFHVPTTGKTRAVNFSWNFDVCRKCSAVSARLGDASERSFFNPARTRMREPAEKRDEW